MFPFSSLTLHNITETAPETWEGGYYDEKSDVFSFSVILWRLFSSEDNHGLSTLEDPYEFLKENGKPMPPPKQREVIRKVPLCS